MPKEFQNTKNSMRKKETTNKQEMDSDLTQKKWRERKEFFCGNPINPINSLLIIVLQL
ncbi:MULTISPECIES: hypothetical protein [unclassified Wolbachia]|uniref:hypothetical protein n=1 Tax=unclassified Wolbachia TaxID=2640676 RepID=UPI002231E91E|nr:hypothetical protein [Wolbachia endosymbiont (group A) of Apoderus coryli]